MSVRNRTGVIYLEGRDNNRYMTLTMWRSLCLWNAITEQSNIESMFSVYNALLDSNQFSPIRSRKY